MVLVLLLAFSAVRPLPAQVHASERAGSLLVNGALGVATVGVRQVITGQFSWRGLAQGAAGGMVMSAGKQITGTGFAGSGLVGRQVNAVGISLVASAHKDTLVLFVPLGPFSLEARPRVERRLRPRVDAADFAVLLYNLLDGPTHLDWGATLSAGAPVFGRPGDQMPLGYDAAGFALMGTVFLSDDLEWTVSERRRLLAHESIHVLQWDAIRQLVSFPVERAAVQHLPILRHAGRYVDAGILAPGMMFLVASQIPYEKHPWEREAYRLTGR